MKIWLSKLLLQLKVTLDLSGIQRFDIYAHVPGMLVSGLDNYGVANQVVPGLSPKDFADSNTVKRKKFDYTLSKAKVIHLSKENGGSRR